MNVNQPVNTPIGKGLVKGAAIVVDGHGELVTIGVYVRLPINAETRGYMKKSNCMTPHASLNGLWVFQTNELEGAMR